VATEPYLDLIGFRALTVMPGEFVDELEARQPGWILAQLASWSASINARLRKRYPNLPFAAPYPDAVCGWLQRIVTLKVAMRRGVDPSDAQYQEYVKDSDLAVAELKEAADGEVGLFDLPIAAGGDAQNSGIGLGGPRVYSEQSPYVWTDDQSCTGRSEDRFGGGTSG
jgi:hypothetical protein